jgi:alpha-tubulin suppressor-like RCC1 family protein
MVFGRARRAALAPRLVTLLIAAASCGGDPPTQPLPPAIDSPPPGYLRFTAISAGQGTACGLTADGETYCWGAAVGASRPRLMDDAPAFTSIDVHAMWSLLLCGLDASGTAHCHRRGEFVEVPAAEPFTGLAAGTANCARSAEGVAFCWTYSTGAGTFSGVLGDGSTTADGYVDGTPVSVAGNHRFGVLASTYLSACGITLQQQAYCWGSNAALTMGDGDASDAFRLTPSPVAGGHAFASISLSPSHACAITTSESAYCWGYSLSGQLGNPAAATVPCPGVSPGECAPSPVRVSGTHRFTQIAAGGSHSCALDQGGVAYCWGSNSWGELGIGRRAVGQKEQAPVRIAGDLRFRAIEAGQYYTCAIATNDATYCWGTNQAGQLGANLPPGHVSTVPQPIAVP